jgi:hypothetical protein
MSLLGEHRDGTMAEFVCIPAENGLAIPNNLDFAQAAALGVNYLTAWRMLFTKAKLQHGETALEIPIALRNVKPEVSHLVPERRSKDDAHAFRRAPCFNGQSLATVALERTRI